MQHTKASALDDSIGRRALREVYLPSALLILAWLAAIVIGACAGTQRPTVEQAKAGLRLACDGLAFAMAEGAPIPGPELAERVCNVERTAAVMQVIVEQSQRVREPMVDTADWFDRQAPLPGARSDAGAP